MPCIRHANLSLNMIQAISTMLHFRLQFQFISSMENIKFLVMLTIAKRGILNQSSIILKSTFTFSDFQINRTYAICINKISFNNKLVVKKNEPQQSHFRHKMWNITCTFKVAKWVRNRKTYWCQKPKWLKLSRQFENYWLQVILDGKSMHDCWGYLVN